MTATMLDDAHNNAEGSLQESVGIRTAERLVINARMRGKF
jgi:hypothetical protein